MAEISQEERICRSFFSGEPLRASIFLEVLSLIFCNFFVVCGLPVYHERCSSKHVEKREDKITQGQ